MKYRGKCSGMGDHFDTSGVFEISKFDISKLAYISNAGILWKYAATRYLTRLQNMPVSAGSSGITELFSFSR